MKELNCCLYFTASKLHRVINKMAEEEFSAIGLSPTYAFVIMVINNKPGVSPSEISDAVSIKPSTTTRFIDKLVDKGYVKRSFEGKYSYISLTEEGKKLMPEIDKCWANLYDRYSKVLGYDEGDRITKEVNDIANKLM
ncbi:MAG: MarR family transcriptional regulator [Clostridia bacterium]|jgi:DNA-binding MarR family transcriptional regulator|nr:MarR family transcriptional regulator [Clostridia bacterium]